MPKINTVLGPLDTADLGFTLMHEHVLVAPPATLKDYPELLGPHPLERAVESLKAAKAGGVETIVDLTTLDLGRDVDFLAEVSLRSGVNIVATTGWWLDYPRWFEGVSADQLADLFVREIEKGMAGTGVKAGLLKSASDLGGVTPGAEIVLRAVARAHLRTGAPIALHSYAPGRVAFEQLAIMKQEKVPLSRVKIDHCNDTTDVEYLLKLLDMGCYLGLDRYPGRLVSPTGRTRTLKALIDAGFADRLCPSHDHITVWVEAERPIISKEDRLRANPYGYLYMKKAVFPELLEMGVSQKVIDRLCVVGPRKFLEGA